VPTLTLPHGVVNATAPASKEGDAKSPVKSPKKKSDAESTVAAGGSSKTTTNEAKSPKNAGAQADVPPEYTYVSTFIIGLSFQKGSRFLDIEPPIQEFDYKVKMWAGKKPTMDLRISMFNRDSAPDFVRQTKAEPSNVSSCTPQTKRKQDQAHVQAQRRHDGAVGDVPDPAARLLFPSSAVKSALPRDRSDTSLSLTAEMSHSSISSNLFSDNGASIEPQRGSPRGSKNDSPVAARQTRSQGKGASAEKALPMRSTSTSPPLTAPAVQHGQPMLPVPQMPERGAVSPPLQVPPGFLPHSMAPVVQVPATLSYRNAASAANGYIINHPAPRGAPMAPAAVGNGYVSTAPPFVANEVQPGIHSLPYGYPVSIPAVSMSAHPLVPPGSGLGGSPRNGVLPAPCANGFSHVPAGMEPLPNGYLPAQPVGEYGMQQTRPMPFPSMPAVMPPARGLSASPPKRLRKDPSSGTAAAAPGMGGGGGNNSSSNSSSSSLDGSNNNKASRKK